MNVNTTLVVKTVTSNVNVNATLVVKTANTANTATRVAILLTLLFRLTPNVSTVKSMNEMTSIAANKNVNPNRGSKPHYDANPTLTHTARAFD